MEGQPVSREELSAEEIERVVRAGAQIGVERVKLTGGEPTLRSDLVEIVSRLRPLVKEVSMTTNGLKLDALAPALRAAGLARVNVSLPSIDPATYERLTGVDGASRAVAGIRAAVRAGLIPVKINVVALDGTSAEAAAVGDLVRFAQEVDAWVQVIEFENVRGRVDPRVYQLLHSDLARLTHEAAERAFKVDHNRLHDRPRYTYEREGKPVTVEVVQPVENPAFCMACHRLRLTAQGQLKGCLMTNEGLVDLKPLLRGGSDAPLVEAFRQAVARRRPYFVGPMTPTPAPLPESEDETFLPMISGPMPNH